MPSFRQAHILHAQHYLEVASEAGKSYLKAGENALRGLEFFDRERAHIESAFEWIKTRQDRGSLSDGDDVKAVAQMRKAYDLYHECGSPIDEKAQKLLSKWRPQ